MPPPARPQDFNRDQALRAIDVFRRGGLTPDQYRVLEATQPPAQLAQLQQQFAQVTDPRAGFDPNDPGAVLTDAAPAPAPVAGGAMRSRFFGGAVPGARPAQPSRLPEGVAIEELTPQDRAAAGIPEGGILHGERTTPVTPVVSRGSQYGVAPGGGGDATFGAPGTQTRERGQSNVVDPDLYTDLGPTMRPRERSVEEGGASARTRYAGQAPGGYSVFDVGDGRQVHVPGNIVADPNAYRAWVNAHRSSGGDPNDFSDPANPSFDEVVADQLIQQYPRIWEGAWGVPGGGPGEPRMDATVRQQLREPGQMSAVTAARLGAADLAVEGAHGFAQAAGDAGLVGRTAVGQRVSGAQAAEAADMERRAGERTQRLMAGLEGVDRRLDDVASMRVDVNEAFGGMGGRIGAAIAVALGSIASSLGGGGENQALAIVNSIVERNLQAQRSNIDNARADANARGNAFRDMAGLLGDEEAATQAARALHLTAIAAAGDRFVQGLDQQQQTAWQLLRSRLMEQAAVARQAAQEMAATATTTDVRLGFRGGQSAVMSSVARATGQSAGQPGQMPAPSASNGQARPAGQGPRTATPAAEQTEQPTTVPPQGRAPDPEAVVEMQAAWATERPPALPPGVRYLRGEGTSNQAPTAQRTFEDVWRHGGPRAQAAAREAMTLASYVGNTVDEITSMTDEFGAELLQGAEPDAADALALAQDIRNTIRQTQTGAAFTEAERAEYEARFPDPNPRDLENIAGWFRRVQNRWRGSARAILIRQRIALSAYGLEPDSAIPPRVRAAREELDEVRTEASRPTEPQADGPSLMDRALDASPYGAVRAVLGD